MDYYELCFTSSSQLSPEVTGDLLAAELGKIGFESFAQDAEGTKAYIPVPNFREEELDKCLTDFPIAGIHFQYSRTLIVAKDWNEVWETNYFRPVRIGRECVIRAPFHPHEPDVRYEIIIHPKMAFGTGNHETTSLMIGDILNCDLTGRDVLDMGCGTGVLAILAAKKGAERIVAVDIDEWAYRNAIENCRLNNANRIEVLQGGAEQIRHLTPFDYIFANINRNILLNNIASYVQALRPGGFLLLSGFYESDLSAVVAECERHGLEKYSLLSENQWIELKLKRPDKG
ncbi:MAG: 50S ribosomal protein L11 methyltransferase [Tannerella sp.]|jgi:ribosomal protein L11 methyltransferase|nr:50S ribosomal protein L11 methyltransferase [Tannerella sp.]